MPIDPDHLLNYDIPEVTQRYDGATCALYALSLGLGQDPLDRDAISYVGGAGRVTAFPTLPVVLCHPGFWLADPATGVDAVRLVHGEQSVELVAPIPAEGIVRGKTRVTGLVDKGEGRGALLYSEKKLHDADNGELLAITRSTTFLRGDGGFGESSGVAGAAPRPVPDRAPDLTTRLTTRPEQALLYRWNGDSNPLHCDPLVARQAGFPRPILHGLCTFAMAARAIIETQFSWRNDALKTIGGRFTAPVYPGETLKVDIWRSGAFRVTVPERKIVAIDYGSFSPAE